MRIYKKSKLFLNNVPLKPKSTGLTTKSYQSLLSEIEALCLSARRAMGMMYWKIGQRIVEAEQEGEDKAPYGKQLVKRLSRDLTLKFGNGFSKRHLERMRRFYLENRIAPPAAQLSMSHQIEALSIKDPKRRKMLLEKAARKNLSRSQFRQLLHNEKISSAPEITDDSLPKEPAKKLTVTRARMYTYQILEPGYIHPVEEMLTIDLGFNFLIHSEIKNLRLKAGEFIESAKSGETYSFKHSDAKPRELYTYKALVERVVDGDTIWLTIDLGFSCWTRQKIRMRGIDCPELSTKKGLEAKAFVEAKLKEVEFVVVKTYKDDKYGRYLTDVFLRAAVDDPFAVLEQGVFLNQELLDLGLAMTM